MTYDKILIISERWWPDGTGGILASHLITQVLLHTGFRLTVLHGTKKPARVNGVNYVYTDLLSVRDKHRLWTNCLLLSRRTWFLKVLNECDVVYIPRYCYPIIPVAKRFGKRVIVHLHDYQPVSYNSVVFSYKGTSDKVSHKAVNVIDFELLEHESISRALFAAFTSPMNRLCRIWLRNSDMIVCVSMRQAEIISKMAPELTSKMKVIYNPLPNILSIEEKNLGNPTFLYVGGESYVKGFHIFLRGSRKILGKYHFVKFLIAGILRKKSSQSIINMLNYRYENAYLLLGHVPHSEISKFHAVSYALLFPSICEEASPYAVMESMAAGTLPIASRVGGVPELVEGTFAEKLLFAPGDTDEFIDRMEKILSMSKEQISNVGLKLRESFLKRFNNELTKRKLLEAFQL